MQNVLLLFPHFSDDLLRSRNVSEATELELLAVEQNPTKVVGRVRCWEFRQLQAGNVCIDRVKRYLKPVCRPQFMRRWSSEAWSGSGHSVGGQWGEGGQRLKMEKCRLFHGSQVLGKLGLGPFPRWPPVVHSGSVYRAESPACETGNCLHSLCFMQ